MDAIVELASPRTQESYGPLTAIYGGAPHKWLSTCRDIEEIRARLLERFDVASP